MSSTWSSGIGKFKKKDPDHGKWWKKIKHLLYALGYPKKKCCGDEGCGCKAKLEQKAAPKALVQAVAKEVKPTVKSTGECKYCGKENCGATCKWALRANKD